jgi:hypothetical protein
MKEPPRNKKGGRPMEAGILETTEEFSLTQARRRGQLAMVN